MYKTDLTKEVITKNLKKIVTCSLTIELEKQEKKASGGYLSYHR